MKRLFVAASVLSIVVSALAFAPTAQNFCFYKKATATSSTCPLVSRPQSFVEKISINELELILNEDASGNCAAFAPIPAQCVKGYDVVVELP